MGFILFNTIRSGIFEIMNVSYAVRNLINTGATADEIRSKAVEEGMSTLRDACTRMILEGRTTIDELVRVAYTS